MSKLRLTCNVDAWFDAVDAHIGPGPETIAALDAGMDAAYQQSQADVHVITGSLRNSGRVETSHDEGEWTGELIYGGPSPGFPNDPVRYANYEKGRGGDHDFLTNVHIVESDLEEALHATVRARGAAS